MITTTRGWAVLLLALAACSGGPDLNIEIAFPDEATRLATTGIVVTAVEPFAAGDDAVATRQLVHCGEIGVFPPAVKFSRDGSEVAGLDHVLLNREFHRYPLDDTWSLEIPPFGTAEDVNPWHAVLVHLEARGPASTYDRGLGQEEDKTLLEGCFCMRLAPSGSHSDKAIDDELKSICPAYDPKAVAPTAVPLVPVVRPEFRLEPCGVRTLTAPNDRMFAAEPGVCVQTVRCDESPDGQACFRCPDARCAKLDDKKNAPVLIEVEGLGAGSQSSCQTNEECTAGGEICKNGRCIPKPRVVLTDKSGKAVPEIPLGNCDDRFTLRASILGRVGESVEFEVKCVPTVKFCEAPDDGKCDETGMAAVRKLRDIPQHQLPDPALQPRVSRAQKVIGMTVLPKARGASGGDRLAVLLEGVAQAMPPVPPSVFLYEASAAGLRSIRTATLALTGEEARAIYGFYYKPSPGTPETPLLAVITTKSSTISGGPKTQKLRILSYDALGGGRLQMVGPEISGDCPICSCTEMPACESCEASAGSGPCKLAMLRADTLFSVTSADVNGDGFNDIAFGPWSDTTMTTYYSTGDPQQPFARGQCACSKFGKALSAFELLRIGGPPVQNDPLLERRNVDFIVGDLTGAFLRYAEGPRWDGPLCDPARPSCPMGTECVSVCQGVSRCLERCSMGAQGCRALPMSPMCAQTMMSPTGGYCAGPKLVCGEPRSVWGFVNVHDIAKGHFGNGELDDAVAVGSGSPVPGVEGEGKLRIIFGDDLNLTTLEQDQPRDVRARSYLDLVPRAFTHRMRSLPQKPRKVEVGEFNGDGHHDLAVLFTGTEEVHVWLGAKNRGAGEISRGPILDCKSACETDQRCSTQDRMVVADFDGDGRSEIVGLCIPENVTGAARPTLRWFKPVAP